MKLTDLLDPHELAQEIFNGYVSGRVHNDDEYLVIYNYTKKAQAEKRWNNVTMNCRGLIVRYVDDLPIIARPWRKFFNLGEYPEGAFNLEAEVAVSDKADGSLGILYPHPKGGYAIATRGSFHSEQAEKGTQILQKAISGGFNPNPKYTYLFEVIYPQNRIVLDYGDREELVLLAVLDTETGEEVMTGDGLDYWFRRPVRWVGTLRQAIEAPARPNSEGWVARFVGTQTRVKIKQADYLRLHRIVTGLNELTVWEWIRDHGSTMGLVEYLPEEFEEWVFGIEKRLVNEYYLIRTHVWADYYEIAPLAEEPTREERKLFAEKASASKYPGLLFLALDEKYDHLKNAVWQMVRPKGVTPTAKRHEEAA